MCPGKLLWRCILLLVACGCAAGPPPPGVVRIDPQHPPKSVEGPMPGFGPFDSSSDALLAACSLILSKPNATTGRRDEQGFGVRWRVSTEYCAWLYYTPDDKYEMSMLVESTDRFPIHPGEERGCRMPSLVEDRRYPRESLKYVYILHNHPAPPFDLSDKDVRGLAQAARLQGKFVETRQGRIPISIVAFFSNAYQPPSCDGFIEYNQGDNAVVKWTPEPQGEWRREKMGTITWTSDTDYSFEPE